MIPSNSVYRTPSTPKRDRCDFCAHATEDLVADVLERERRPISVRICVDEVSCARRCRERRGRGPTTPGGVAVAA
ncbi:MAG: hypothetical protein JWM87_664 [Candidatus Eremiobacteraeota bacterium]|nr:hypothetical protein [Candidatus Eremiobacteraeota bacterium]